MSAMYLTKYALSGGIREFEAERSTSEGYVRDLSGRSWTIYKIGREAFETLEDAKLNAEKRRAKKVASLRKQIVALEKLDFDATKARGA